MSPEIRTIVAAATLSGLVAPAALAQQPSSTALSGLMRDAACAPAAAGAMPRPAMAVIAGRERGKTLFGIGDALVIDAGTAQGIRTGNEYYARRVVADRFTEPVPGGAKPISIHTSGVIRIVEAANESSIGIVTHGCDGVLTGDYLERFQAPELPGDTLAGTPDYAQAGHLILADDRRQIGGRGDFMVVDRGSRHGIQTGQRLTIFRKTVARDGAPVSSVGSATVYAVGPDTSGVRIEGSTEAVYVGDLVAVHR